jgi:hypothetical protein
MEKSVSKSVPMMPGKNGGKLRAGSLPGNKGGTGRPPSEVRALAAEGAHLAASRLIELMQDGLVNHPSEIARAFDVCAKYSIGAKVTVSSSVDPEMGAFVAELPARARDRFGEEVAEWLASEIKAFAEQHRQGGEG